MNKYSRILDEFNNKVLVAYAIILLTVIIVLRQPHTIWLTATIAGGVIAGGFWYIRVKMQDKSYSNKQAILLWPRSTAFLLALHYLRLLVGGYALATIMIIIGLFGYKSYQNRAYIKLWWRITKADMKRRWKE